MIDETINKKFNDLRLSVKKGTAIANERKLKIVNDLVSHKGSNI